MKWIMANNDDLPTINIPGWSMMLMELKAAIKGSSSSSSCMIPSRERLEASGDD
jgi:hypothetical protein